MVRIAGRHASGLDPRTNDIRLFVYQTLQRSLQLILDMRRALQNLIGEKATFTRIVPCHLQLTAQIRADFRMRITTRIEGTLENLVSPAFPSVESCGSLAVNDALAIATSMIDDELATGRKQVGYVVDGLNAAVKDHGASEESAGISIRSLERNMG